MLETNRQDFNQRASITRSACARAEENHKQENAETIEKPEGTTRGKYVRIQFETN